jgi:hypothetical protein
VARLSDVILSDEPFIVRPQPAQNVRHNTGRNPSRRLEPGLMNTARYHLPSCSTRSPGAPGKAGSDMERNFPPCPPMSMDEHKIWAVEAMVFRKLFPTSRPPPLNSETLQGRMWRRSADGRLTRLRKRTIVYVESRRARPGIFP